ncbi:MAG: hypothetical protein ACE5I7_07185, partial [Candidatus Binatia bacterium]
MSLYPLLGICLALWAGLGAYVLSGMKRTYEDGAALPHRLLHAWFAMWGPAKVYKDGELVKDDA